jgi:hypothetical protein
MWHALETTIIAVNAVNAVFLNQYLHQPTPYQNASADSVNRVSMPAVIGFEHILNVFIMTYSQLVRDSLAYNVHGLLRASKY